MISPKHNDRVVRFASCFQSFDHPPDLSVGIRNASRVVPSHFGSEIGIVVRIPFPTVVLHELARAVPGRLAFRLCRVSNRRQLDSLVKIEVLLRSTKRQMRADDANSEKERFVFLRFGQQIQLTQGFVNDQSVRVNRIRPLDGLKEIHL